MAEPNTASGSGTVNNTQDGVGNSVINIRKRMLEAVVNGTVKETCSIIIQAGVNKRYENNKTSLMVAIEIGCEEFVESLITAGADVDAEDEMDGLL